MKKTILVAVLLTVISAVSFAGTNSISEATEFQVVKVDDNHYQLYYVSKNIDDVFVRIVSENGKVITTDKIQDIKAFRRTYDFVKLSAGNYAIEVSNKEGKASQAVFYNPCTNINLHTIVGKLPNENKFKVYVAPCTSKGPVDVKIYDGNGNLLIKESITKPEGFSKVYDLTQIEGEYVTFSLTKGREETSYTRYLK